MKTAYSIGRELSNIRTRLDLIDAVIGGDLSIIVAALLKLDNIESGADVTSVHETSHADVLVDGDIGVTVQAYNANLITFNVAAVLGTL